MPAINIARFRSRKVVRDDKASSGSLGGCVSVDEIVIPEEPKDTRSAGLFQRSKSQVEGKGRFGKRLATSKDSAPPPLPSRTSSRVGISQLDAYSSGEQKGSRAVTPSADISKVSSVETAPSEDVETLVRPKTADASIGGHRLRTAASLSSLPPMPRRGTGQLEVRGLNLQRPSSSNGILKNSSTEVSNASPSQSSPESQFSRRNRSEASLPLVAKTGTKYSFTPSLNTPDNQRSSRASAINANAQALRIIRGSISQAEIRGTSTKTTEAVRPKDLKLQEPTDAQDSSDVALSATITGFVGSDMYWDSFDPSYYDMAGSPEGSEHGDSPIEKEVVEEASSRDQANPEQTQPPTYAAELDSLPITVSSIEDNQEKALDKKEAVTEAVTEEPLAIIDAEPDLPRRASFEAEGGPDWKPSVNQPRASEEEKPSQIIGKTGFGHARKQSQAARELKDARLKILSLNLSQHHAEPSLEQFAQQLLDKLSPTSAHFLAQNMALPASPDPSELSASPISPRSPFISSPLVASKPFGQFLGASNADPLGTVKPLSKVIPRKEEPIVIAKGTESEAMPARDVLGISLSIDTMTTPSAGVNTENQTPTIIEPAEELVLTANTEEDKIQKSAMPPQSSVVQPPPPAAISMPTLTGSQSLPPTPIEQPFAVPIAIAANLKNLQAAYDSQKRKAANLAEENETLRTQLTAVLKKMAESDSFRLERDRIDKQHKETKAKMKLLDDELTELKASNQTTLNRYEAMQAKLDEAHEQKLDVLEENHELHGKVKMHEKTISTLEARIRSIQEEEATAKAEKVKEITQTYEKTIENLKVDLGTVRAEAKELQGRPEKAVLQASEKKVAGLLTELKALQEVTAELMLRPEKKLLDALEKKSKTLYDRNKVLQSEKKTLETQITQLEEQSLVLEEQLTELRAKPDLSLTVAELTTRMTLLEQDIQEKSSQVLRLQMQKVQLEQLVSTAESAVAVAEAKVLELAAAKKLESRRATADASTATDPIPAAPVISERVKVPMTEAGHAEAEKKIKKIRAERDKFEQLLHAEFRRNALEMHDRKHPLASKVAKKIDMDQATKSLRQKAEMAIAGLRPGDLPTITKERSANSNHILSQLAGGESSEQGARKPEETIRNLEAEISYYLTDIVLFKLDVRGYKKDLRKAQDKIKQLSAGNDGVFRNSAGDEIFEMPAMPLTPERRRSLDEASASAEQAERNDRADRIVSVAPSEAVTEIIVDSKPSSIAEGPMTGVSLDFGNPFGPPLVSPTFSTSSETQSSSSTARNGSVVSTAPSEITQVTQISERELSFSNILADAVDVPSKSMERNDRALLPSQKARQRDMPQPIRPTGLRKAGSLDEIVTNPNHVRSLSSSAKAAAAMGLSIALGPGRSASGSVLIGSPLSSVTSANSPSTDGIPSPFTTSPPPSASFYSDSQHRVVSPSPILTPPLTSPNTPTLFNKSSDASLGSADDEKILVESATVAQIPTHSGASTAQTGPPLAVMARKVSGPTLVHQVAQQPITQVVASKDPVRQVREVERTQMTRRTSPSPLRSHPAMHMAEKPSVDLDRRVALANGTLVNRPGSAASGSINNSPRKYAEAVGRASQDTVQSEASALMEMMTVGFMPANGA